MEGCDWPALAARYDCAHEARYDWSGDELASRAAPVRVVDSLQHRHVTRHWDAPETAALHVKFSTSNVTSNVTRQTNPHVTSNVSSLTSTLR